MNAITPRYLLSIGVSDIEAWRKVARHPYGTESSARKTRPATQELICRGGPFDGEAIILSEGYDDRTLTVRVREYVGFYQKLGFRAAEWKEVL